MPHQDYLRRLIDDEKSSPAPASSVERGDSSPSDFNHQHTHLGSRALAALAQDESESSIEEGDEPTGDTPRAMSAPLFTVRDPPPPIGQGEMAGTLQNLQHTKALGISLGGSPAGSVANRCSSTASGSSGRPPSNSIASAKNAGRATMNGVASSRNNDAGLSTKRITFAGPAHYIGLKRHSFNIGLADTTGVSKNLHIKGAPESVRNDRQNRGIPPTNRNGVVDLTMDSSDEDEVQLSKNPSKKQKTQSLSRSHDYEKINDYREDHVSIQQTENEKKSNHETLKKDDNVLAATDKFIDPIPNDFGARQPLPTSANNESIRQTVNLAIKQEYSKDEFNASKSPSQMSSAATKIEAAVEARNCAICMHELETGLNVHRGNDVLCPRSRHYVPAFPSTAAAPLPDAASAAEPAGASEKLAPADKSASTLVCSLSGSLSSTTRDGNLYHISRGFWEYENHKKFGFEHKSFQSLGSNRFELCRQISSDIETPPLTKGGIFNGSFAYSWSQKGEPEESYVIHESDVNISFIKQDEESFALTGTGRNQVGEFHLLGTVWKWVTGVSFSLQCRKEYSKLSELLSSPDDIQKESTTWLPTNRDDNEHRHTSVVDRKKMRLSTTNQIFKSVGSGECRIKKRDTDEASISMISTSLNDSNASHTSDDVDLSDDDAAEANEEVDTSTSSTLVGTSHIKKLQEKAGSVVTVFSSSKKNTASDTFNKIGAPAIQKSWQEIGDYESIHPKGTEHTVEKSQTNDAREACYDMEGVTPNEDQARRVQSDPQHEQVLLETILGSHWASILNSHCGLKTASELYNANGEELINRLIGVVGADFKGRQEKDVEILTEGLLYGWYIQVKEALHVDESISEKTPPTSQRKAEGDSIRCLAFLTPLSYVDLLFIKSQRIKSDFELSGTDPSLLAHRYSVYLSKEISLTDAFEVATKWRQGARLALGMISNDICDNLPQITRLEKGSIHKEIMHTVSSLSMTVPDKENGGLPRRTMFTLDTINSKC